MVAVHARLQPALDALFDRRTSGREHVVERRTGDHRLSSGFGGGAHRGSSIQLAKNKFVRPREVVVDGCVQLDHVLIARKHERLLGLPLESPGSVLYVPFVSGGLRIGLGCIGAEADFYYTYSPVLYASELIDRPRQLVVNSRTIMRQYLPAESLNDPDFFGRNDVDAAQQQAQYQDGGAGLD